LIREETVEQENTIDSKKQEYKAENNGIPDENSHKNVEETMDLQNQPGTVEKRDIKRVCIVLYCPLLNQNFLIYW
jgi:hypothetical protein